MEDDEIIKLYFSRDERAIRETRNKYNAYLMKIASALLDIHDAQECVSDVYFIVWNKIPPLIPGCFRVFIGRIARNISVSRYRAEHSKKRSGGIKVLLSELDDCIPSSSDVERSAELSELTELMNEWLASLSEQDRALFIRRYWYGEELKTLAALCGISGSNMAQKMFRLRKALKKFLEERGAWQ